MLELDSIQYSVVAERDGDAERSNWSGKSYLLEALPFAFYGEHRHRLESGWISEGEQEGEVTADLSDGTRVHRWRKPGAGTQLSVSRSTKGKRYFVDGAEGQREVEALIGLSLEDFRTTSWLAQGQAAAIVRGDPATRTAMVARWLGIEKLEGALKIARTRAGTVEREAEALRARIAAQEERLTRALGDAQNVLSAEVVASLEAKLAEWDELLVLANEEESGKRLAEERGKLESEIAALVAEAAEASHETVVPMSVWWEERDQATARHAAAKTKSMNRSSVRRGMFDGCCPVAGRSCPVTVEINALGDGAREEADRAHAEEVDAAERLRMVVEGLRRAEADARLRTARNARLRTLQDRLYAMGGGLGPQGGSGLVLEAVRRQRDAVSQEVHGSRYRLREVQAAEQELESLRGEAGERDVVLGTVREGAALLARAPRRLAEGALHLIAREANGILSSAGVELSLGVSWERATKDPAETCDACGAALPRSARVKECGCGEARGQKRVRRLDVDLSARSGAAEDLAGLALSLAAGTWLRGERGSGFGLALLDEVGSQLDRSHRRMMAQHLPRMLGAARVEQALVVSHSPESVLSLPGRIVVRSDGKWARVEVA